MMKREAEPSGSGEESGTGEGPGPERRQNPTVEHLSFMLGEEEYGVAVPEVKEVIWAMEILEVPRVPGFVRGVISLRGTIIPVFDVKKRMGFPEVSFTSRTRFVILSLNDAPYGLVADSVVGVVSVDPERIESPPAGLKVPPNFLRGVVPYGGDSDSREGLLILLNLERVFAL